MTHRSGPGQDSETPPTAESTTSPRQVESWLGLSSHRRWLLDHAFRLVDFFRPTLDVSGRFVELDDDGAPMTASGAGAGTQSLLTVARATHCFALAEILGVPGCSMIVERGLEALWEQHRDRAAGGYRDAVGDRCGSPTRSAYGHAFVLLAASSAIVAGHDARPIFDDVLAVIDDHFWSEEDGASREAFGPDWNELEPYRGANSNMHLCEAYLAAADATADGALAARAARIARLIVDGRARSHSWMLPEHYDRRWAPRLDYNRDRLDDPFRPYGVTVGHLLEWSRLTLSAWIATGRRDEWMRECARELFSRALEVGWDDEHGGLSYTVDFDGGQANPDHYWWPVAEGIAASSFLLQLEGEPIYEQWYRKLWEFAGAHLVDHVRGGWYAELDHENRRKSGPWHGKPDLYHALQASLLPLVAPGPSLAVSLRQGL